LGDFSVEVDGQIVPPGAWKHRRGAELIKLLALATGHRLHRKQVMDTLWPDLSPDAAGTNLRKATHHLRRALGTADPIVVDGGFVALCPDWPVSTDVETFEAAAKAALGAGPDACAEASALYLGELLPDDRYVSWTFEPRERLRLRYLQLLKLSRRWETVLEVDPTDEEAPSALALAFIRSAETEIARGRRWQASRLLDKAVAISDTSPLVVHLMVRAYAARVLSVKAADQALAVLNDAERALRGAAACQPCSIGYHITAATTRARSGDLANAREHLDKAERIAGVWQGGPWQAAVWEARGIIRIAEGNRDQGHALLNEAANLFGNAGRPLDAARCRVGTA
jgi:DNA-binding SARP family transcriptional activator